MGLPVKKKQRGIWNPTFSTTLIVNGPVPFSSRPTISLISFVTDIFDMFWYISFVTGIYWYIFVSFVTNIFEEALPPVLSQISFQLHLGLPHCNSAYADYIHVFILGILSLLPSHVWVFPIPCSTMQVSFSSLASPWGWIHLPWTWRKESSNTDQLVGLTFLQGHSHGILPWSSLKRLHLVLLKSRAAIWCSSSLPDTELHNPWSLQPRLPPAFLVD